MSDLRRFDMHGNSHANGNYCDANEAADLIESLQARISELEQERDELAATVESIRRAYLAAGVDIQMLFELQPLQPDNSYLVDGQDCTELDRVISQAPATNLNAVKRDVAKEAFLDGCSDLTPDDEMLRWAESYINERYPDKE